jgi:RNA polymerase sigma-70 factor (ECF subfamily)
MRVEKSLRAVAAAGRAAWPDLAIDEEVFVRHLERHLQVASDRDAAIAKLRPGDLYLACACAQGKSEAITAFEQRFASVIDRTLARFAKTDQRRAELRQVLLERLFVAPPGGEARIASYGGQGFLENWLRIAAMRAFMNEAEKGSPRESGDEALDAMSDGRDIELDFLKSHYRAAFRSAFAEGLASLEPAERLVLRLTVLEGLSCDELAVSLGVHRATAARRTARARQKLVDATREALARALRVDDVELASILRLVESKLDLSISRLLGADEGSGETHVRAKHE